MIGDFDYIEAYTSGEFSGESIQCRVYTPVGLADQGHYSLDLAVKVIAEYGGHMYGISIRKKTTAYANHSSCLFDWSRRSSTFHGCLIYLTHCLSWTWWRSLILLLVRWKTGV